MNNTHDITMLKMTLFISILFTLLNYSYYGGNVTSQMQEIYNLHTWSGIFMRDSVLGKSQKKLLH